MMPLKIALIDSGIENSYFNDVIIEQYGIINGSIVKEDAKDYMGHGSLMAGVIYKKINCKLSFLSIRLGSNNMILDAIDLAVAIKYAVNMGCKIINISLGIESMVDRKYIEEACDIAYKHKIPIITAVNPNGNLTLPWVCKSVIKVKNGKYNNGFTIAKDKTGVYVVSVNKYFFKTIKTKDSEGYIKGNSAAAAYMTACLSNLINSEVNMLENLSMQALMDKFFCKYVDNSKYNINVCQLFKKIQLINKKLTYINREFKYLCNCIAVPYSKEVASLIRFGDLTDFRIKGILSPKMNIKQLNKKYGIDLDKLQEIKVFYHLDVDNLKEIDSLIIGYLDEVEQLDPYFSLDNLLNIALSNRLNVYCFVPVSEEIKKVFNKEGLIIDYPPKINEDSFIEIRNVVSYPVSSKKLCLGVFGTSSKQGKFTLQVLIREGLKKRNIKVDSIGTEHQSELLKFSTCFPCGYAGNKSIEIPVEKQVEYLTRLITYMEETLDGDLILFGGQSRLIPYNIQEHSAYYNLCILDGVKPDFAVLTINPLLDPTQYVLDTIACLESVFKCTVISLAFSDTLYSYNNNNIVHQKIEKKEKELIKILIEERYERLAGCITDPEYIDDLCEKIIKLS